jgi:hypothetical protein
MDTNDRIALAANVELVAPTQKGRGKEALLSQFSFDENGLVTRCPAAHRPYQTSPRTRRSNYGAAFDLQRCRLAKRRALESSEAFIGDYRWRAGVEATMSEFDRRTGVKKLRVRGMPAVRFCARMKAIGLNILRAAAVRKARRKAKQADSTHNGFLDTFIHTVKERIHRLMANPGPILLKTTQTADSYQELAA